MRIIGGAAAGLAALILAGCSSSPGPVVLDRSNANIRTAAVCAADQYQVLVGQPAGEVDMTTLPRPVRMVGMDTELSPTPEPGRMTIITDRDDQVSEVLCN